VARKFRQSLIISIRLLALCPTMWADTAGDTAEESASPKLTVLVYNAAQVPAGVLRNASEEASRIFRHAGIASRWVDCFQAELTHTCRRLAGRETLVARIVAKAGQFPGTDAFGNAFVSADGQGTYSTVFYDRIERMHAERHTGLAALLGHVLAHEVGHLLLGSNAHAQSGIMFANWQSRELRQLVMGHLLFSADQAANLRARLRNRNQVLSAGRLR